MNNETKGFLLFLGGVVWAAVTSKKAYAPTIVTDGGNCKSTLGPQGIEFNGKCYKCPPSFIASGVVAPSEADMECGRRGLSEAISTL